MKRSLTVMLLSMLLLTGCSGLPAEDRCFAVVLGLSEHAGIWEASARVPTYQTGGGYLTLAARGRSLGEAMALLNAAAPMEMHYGQLRLIVFSAEIAQQPSFEEVLQALSARGEVRPQAVIAVSNDPVKDVLDALEPATGSRLSKSLETMMDARERSGVTQLETLDGIGRMGVRMQPVLMNIEMSPGTESLPSGMQGTAGEQPAEGTGKVQMAGGWMTADSGEVKGTLSAAEMQLLSLLRGKLRQGTLSLARGTLTLLDADAEVKLDEDGVLCRVNVRYSAAFMTEEGVQQELISAMQGLMSRLAAAGCDALGLGRKLMLECLTMEEWYSRNWPAEYPSLKWRFVVNAEREA